MRRINALSTLFLSSGIKRGIVPISLFCFSFPGDAQTNASLPLPDADIYQVLKDRVEKLAPGNNTIGIVAGIIRPQGRKIISYGNKDSSGSSSLDGNTIFEIGSVTKVFTALLLAEMVQKGKISLSDPVTKYLPANTAIPARNGHPITLADLATHTSGLAFMPSGQISSDKDIYQYLAGYDPPYDAGTEWEYSNLGYWLLSEALVFRVGVDYKTALRTHILAPLKMKNTGFELTSSMKADLSIGHNAALQPAPFLSSLPPYSLMPAAGGLYSTVNDLLILLSTAMNYEHSVFTKMISDCLAVTRPAENSDKRQALGWTIIGAKNDKLIFRDGGTFGYASCIAYDPVQRTGVVVLSNQVASVSDIARHILRPGFPLENPTVITRKEITLDKATLEKYAGNYDAEGEGIFKITLAEDHLMLEAPSDWGLPSLRIRPESNTSFFATELPLRVTFEESNANDTDRSIRMLIYPPRGQKAIPALKIR